jgi:hypothetical protein
VSRLRVITLVQHAIMGALFADVLAHDQVESGAKDND